MFGLLLAVVVTVVLIKILFTKVQPHFVLFAGGLVLMAGSVLLDKLGLLDSAVILPVGAKGTGFWFLDLFASVTLILQSTLVQVGLLVMAAAAYSKYMTIIGASFRMTEACARVLLRFNAPYLILALAFFVGAAVDVFIPSAAGLAMILMVTLYPILVRLGVSRLSAAALIVTVSALDLGPASGAATYAAALSAISIETYFIDYQIPVSIVVAMAVAILHYFTQSYYDRRDGIDAFEAGYPIADRLNPEELARVPRFYGFLPLLPILFLVILSPYVIDTIEIDPTSVMFLSAMLVLCVELTRKNMRVVLREAFEFFHSMGRQFAVVITLLVAAQTFAQGIAATGAFRVLIGGLAELSIPPLGILLFMVTVMVFASLVMGSANATFFAFAHLVPRFAHDYGVSVLYLILPMQLATGLARSFSPVSAVMIAVAGVSGISPFVLARRTVIPMVGGIAVTVLMTLLFSAPNSTVFY